MQGGFLLLEAGSIRTKNAINVAQKNITDLSICWIMFLVFGYGIMFGIPSPLFSTELNNNTILSFMFQLGFCGAVTTIVSGAIAERMSFKSYMCLVTVISAFIYPIVGWSVWGKAVDGERTAWLADIGFIDFAGSTVVHGVGAWVSLVACILIGPRLGRFDDNGNINTMPGHSPVLSMLGTLTLFLGWFGFNAGSLSPSDDVFGLTLLNTAMAGCFGGVTGLFSGYYVDRGVFNPNRMSAGLLGGLVCITASAAYVSPSVAMLLGVLGGGIAVTTSQWLLVRMKIDDPLDVVAIHGIPGVIGTLALAWGADLAFLSTQTRLEQFFIQCIGVSAVFCFTVTLSYIVLKVIAIFIPLRVNAYDEHLGLNYTEHGVSLSTERLKQALNDELDNSTGAASSINVDQIDESTELANSLNKLLQRHELAREHIKNHATRFQDFARSTSDYFWETDTDFNIIFLSERFERLSEQQPSHYYGMNFLEIINCSAEDRITCKRRMNQNLPINRLDGSFFLGQLPAKDVIDDVSQNQQRRETDTPSDNLNLVEINGVPYFDSDKNFKGYRGTANDVTAQRLAEKRAIFLAHHDELTGLENRRVLNNTLDKCIKKAELQGKGLVIAGIDLDGFKGVNDSYGHSIGDILLQQVALRLREVLRAHDHVYRVGGDEFIAILSNFDNDSIMEHAMTWCHRVVDSLASVYDIETLNINIGASVGISIYPTDGKGAQELIRKADLAMYQAKYKGKGRVVPFQPFMDKEAKLRKELENDFSQAFQNQEFFLCYQPKVHTSDNSTETLLGFEALVRWEHPKRGVIEPKSFLHVIEKLGMTHRLGVYVLNEVCQFAASWDEHDKKNLQLSVNIAPSQLLHKHFVKVLAGILKRTQLPARILELDITENILNHHVPHVSQVLHDVKALGVSIAIDDFGKGNTSLQYLKHFPIDRLKVDRHFIQHMHEDKKSRDITQGVVLLAQQLGLSVTAEGVELSSQLGTLKSWECYDAQGYLFSKPMNVQQVCHLLDENRKSQIKS